MRPAEDLRERLVGASLDLIAEEGIEGFSMREVARRAGVSHQAPYHYFTDREAILAEIVREGFIKLRDDMLVAIDSIAEPGQRLTAIGKAYIRFALNNPAHFKLMFRSELVEPDRHDDAKACALSAFDVLVSTVDDFSKHGRAWADESLVIASWSMVHGLATLMLEGKLEQKFGKGKRAQLEAADRMLELFEHMARAR
jgi:AcrR family transcriptional regulator